MKIGMYSIELKRPSVKELFQAVREKGFTEVQFDFSSVCEEQLPASIDPVLLKEIHDTARNNGVEIVAVNGTYNMIDPDVTKRETGLQRFEVIAKACKDLKCRFITLCTGSRNPESMWRYHEDNNTREAWNDLLESMKKVLVIAERYDLILGIEVEASNCVNSAKKARELLDIFKSDRLKIIMDVANLFHHGQAKKENVRAIMDEAFELLGEDIYLAHGKDIMESDSIMFTHAGNGIVDFPYYLNKLKEIGYKGGMLLHGVKKEEYFEQSVNYILNKIREKNDN